MHEIIIFETRHSLSKIFVPFALFALCVLPTDVVIVAIGLLAPVPFAASAFRKPETAAR